MVLFPGLVALSAADPGLHPLGEAIVPGEIRFRMGGVVEAGEAFGVEAVYRPHRERDVKKTRHLGLFAGWIGGAGREWIRTQREESHTCRQHVTATDGGLRFEVPLRDPEAGYGDYQLEAVWVTGGRWGRIGFDRWFAAAPVLDEGFGLRCGSGVLRGRLRPGGLGADPLRGSLPLWPGLREVEVEVRPVRLPGLVLFEARRKHEWDGWRQTTPAFWPGGHTIVVRHTNGPTVWRVHSYDPVAPSGAGPVGRPMPPEGVLAGVHLDVYWPEGELLEFADAEFGGDVEVVTVSVAKLPERAAALLAESVRQRPGMELETLSAAELEEFEEALPEKVEKPFEVGMEGDDGDGSVLRIRRMAGLGEPWLCVFLTPYEEGRRYRVAGLVLRPVAFREGR